MINTLGIHEALAAAGLPVVGVSVSGNVVTATYSRALTAPEQAQANSIITNEYYSTLRKPRSLHAIFLDISALPGASKVACWSDLNSGIPKRFTMDEGPNAASILVLQWAVESSNTGVSSVQDAQLRIIVFYVQDNPLYLVNPPFLPSLVIYGDEPV
jgi:hypothetical protein